jgi:hypothetical protein
MDKIERLIGFCGYGNFESANIIFMGNEEGLGGGAIEDEIAKRTCKFWEEGKAIDGNEKAKGYYIDKQTYADTRGPFLEFSSRLMKYLNSPEHTDYFKKNSEDPGTFRKIKEYKIFSLYHERPDLNFRSALVDYRPLPRANESLTYSIYDILNERFDWKQYSRAFRFQERNVDDYHLNLRNLRSDILKNVFTRSQETHAIIGIGDKLTKRKFFETHFAFREQFKGRSLSQGKDELFYGKIMINGNIIPIFLSDFFQSGRGIGLSGLEMLAKIIKNETIHRPGLTNYCG